MTAQLELFQGEAQLNGNDGDLYMVDVGGRFGVARMLMSEALAVGGGATAGALQAVADAAAASDANIVGNLPTYFANALNAAGLGDIGTFTLATLPDPALTARRTAWVTNLYGVGGRVVSEGGFWKPIRPLTMSATASPTVDMTITPLVAPTTLLVTGTLSANRNFTLGMGTGFAVPYAGYRQRVTRKATGLTSLLVNGVGLSLNGWADFEFDGAVWVQTASGGLL